MGPPHPRWLPGRVLGSAMVTERLLTAGSAATGSSADATAADVAIPAAAPCHSAVRIGPL